MSNISDEDWERQGDRDCNFDSWDDGVKTCPECGDEFPDVGWNPDTGTCDKCAAVEGAA